MFVTSDRMLMWCGVSSCFPTLVCLYLHITSNLTVLAEVPLMETCVEKKSAINIFFLALQEGMFKGIAWKILQVWPLHLNATCSCFSNYVNCGMCNQSCLMRTSGKDSITALLNIYSWATVVHPMKLHHLGSNTGPIYNTGKPLLSKVSVGEDTQTAK